MASAALPLPQAEEGAAPASPPEQTTKASRSLADRARDWLHALRQTVKYGPGAADVGWLSSRLVAARRAMESEDEPHPLFKDPLAEVLVGPKIMRAARAQARAGRPAIDARGSSAGVGKADKGAAKASGQGRKGAVSRIAARTLWFDAEVLDGVAGVATSAVAVSLSPTPDLVAVAITPRTHAPATQVVCLGAGMDTRAWRLPLPTVAWFEVDEAHVLRAKAAGLRRARAEAPGWDGEARAVTMQAGSRATSEEPPDFPLTVASYAAVVANLNEAGWARALVESCGFDPGAPTVFIAEGLVMYLTAEGVHTLLSEACSIAGPGSVMAVVAATEAAAVAARARSGGRGIMAAWTWGCPPDPSGIWAKAGWAVQTVATRSDIARRWGLGWCEFPVVDAHPCGRGRAERESLFIVAVKE